MPELLFQAAVTSSRNEHFTAEAQRISENCRAQHGEDPKSLIECADCYGALVEAFRTRFLDPTRSLPDQPPFSQQEWLTTRKAFLADLDQLLNSAKAYDIAPQTVDDRVNQERSRWYAETVRGCILRLMVEDPAEQGVVFEKLEDLASVTAKADPVVLAREIADILSKGPLASADDAPEAAPDLPKRLAAAVASGDHAAAVAVLEQAFFSDADSSVPEENRKYLELLRNHSLSMEQVVDRILEDRQAATGVREQTDKLKQRLDELRRARAAHEAQKTRRARRRESLAQMKVPNELYELPGCAVCGEIPVTSEFFCCSLCAIFVAAGVRDKQTVFCSEKCEKEGHASHTQTHECSAGRDCLQRKPLQPLQHQAPNGANPTLDKDTAAAAAVAVANATPASNQEDTDMPDAPPPTPPPPPAEDTTQTAPGTSEPTTTATTTSPSSTTSPATTPAEVCFCTECLTTLKQPTAWCSRSCADASFARHREEVHLPERKKMDLDVHSDEALFEAVLDRDEDGKEGGPAEEVNLPSSNGEGSATTTTTTTMTTTGRRYRAKDIGALITSLEDAVREWESKYRVRLEMLSQS